MNQKNKNDAKRRVTSGIRVGKNVAKLKNEKEEGRPQSVLLIQAANDQRSVGGTRKFKDSCTKASRVFGAKEEK